MDGSIVKQVQLLPAQSPVTVESFLQVQDEEVQLSRQLMMSLLRKVKSNKEGDEHIYDRQS